MCHQLTASPEPYKKLAPRPHFNAIRNWRFIAFCRFLVSVPINFEALRGVVTNLAFSFSAMTWADLSPFRHEESRACRDMSQQLEDGGASCGLCDSLDSCVRAPASSGLVVARKASVEGGRAVPRQRHVASGAWTRGKGLSPVVVAPLPDGWTNAQFALFVPDSPMLSTVRPSPSAWTGTGTTRGMDGPRTHQMASGTCPLQTV